MSKNGKGDAQRPSSVTPDVWSANWGRTFGEKWHDESCCMELWPNDNRMWCGTCRHLIHGLEAENDGSL